MTSASAGVVDASPAERSCRNNRSGKMLLRANCEKSVARAHRANVGLGSFSTEAAYPAARPSSALRRKLTSGRNVKICRDGPNRTRGQCRGFLFDDLVSKLLGDATARRGQAHLLFSG